MRVPIDREAEPKAQGLDALIAELDGPRQP